MFSSLAEVQLVQTPEPETNEALIKVNAVTVNPTDWKHVAFMAPPGVIVGCDFCGVVDSLGPDAKGSIKKGDKVAGFVHGSKDKDRGSFAEYLKTGSELVMTVPEGVHEEEASSVGIAGTTAVQVSGEWCSACTLAYCLFVRRVLELEGAAPTLGVSPHTSSAIQLHALARKDADA